MIKHSTALLPVSDNHDDGFIQLTGEDALPPEWLLLLTHTALEEKEAEGLKGAELSPRFL